MTRSLRSLLTAALACCLVLVGAFLSGFEFVRDVTVSAVRKARDAFEDFALKTFSGPVQMVEQAEMAERKHLTAAQRFLARLAKRERPVIQSEWRMCPSV